MIRGGFAALTVLVLVGCTVVQRVESPDPGAIPTGSVDVGPGSGTGEATVLGSGQVLGVGWRYAIYPAGDDWCLQFETVSVASTGCGPLLPDEGSAFGSVTSGDASALGLRPIYGVVTSDIATVFLIDSDTQERVPAKLYPLDEVGLEAQAFIGFEPEGLTVTDLQALRFNGEIVETYELP